MTEARTCEQTAVAPGPRAVAIGAFDGVHLGHVAVVQSVVAAAERLGLASAALTFEPTPRQYFGREEALRKRLTPDPERVSLLCRLGVQQVLVQSFDEDLRAMSPEGFAQDILRDTLDARFVAIGASHTFGAGGAGGPERMAELGRDLGFEVEVVPVISLAGTPVSSTAVRAALLAGDVALARNLLGRPYGLLGQVVHGLGIGGDLGSPTANLEVRPDKLLPAEGVYAAVAVLPEEDVSLGPAAVVIGPAPTLGIHESRIEAHLLDVEADLYDQELMIGLLARLRGIETFPSRDDLILQIEADIAETRRVVEASAPGPDWR